MDLSTVESHYVTQEVMLSFLTKSALIVAQRCYVSLTQKKLVCAVLGLEIHCLSEDSNCGAAMR